jgi:hypothetical protein
LRCGGQCMCQRCNGAACAITSGRLGQQHYNGRYRRSSLRGRHQRHHNALPRGVAVATFTGRSYCWLYGQRHRSRCRLQGSRTHPLSFSRPALCGDGSGRCRGRCGERVRYLHRSGGRSRSRRHSSGGKSGRASSAGRRLPFWSLLLRHRATAAAVASSSRRNSSSSGRRGRRLAPRMPRLCRGLLTVAGVAAVSAVATPAPSRFLPVGRGGCGALFVFVQLPHSLLSPAAAAACHVGG